MMNANNRITKIFSIEYPIIQGGMVWCSGWELAAAVSNAGGLGLIGSGSMSPDVLRLHIQKTRQATNKPFGVNVPLLYSHADDNIKVVIEEKVPIVFTSAGNPAKWTKILHDHGIIVAHVVSNLYFARKCEEAGVDVLVAEGVEAGGHNGKEENTTMVLVPLLKKFINLPLVAAGGIASGRAMLAAMCLGAEGVQIGSRFAASIESSAHSNFKQKIIETGDGGTRLALRKISPVRIIRNAYSDRLEEAENQCLPAEKLIELKGKGRSRLGMFEGNTSDGELEIGQVAAFIDQILPVRDIIKEIINEYNSTLEKLYSF
ncbi:MAG: nitronate monooxygenase [Bacteroidales bacterium]|nr:nitronate monooxygenase [Bacteroidales bacterium]